MLLALLRLQMTRPFRRPVGLANPGRAHLVLRDLGDRVVVGLKRDAPVVFKRLVGAGERRVGVGMVALADAPAAAARIDQIDAPGEWLAIDLETTETLPVPAGSVVVCSDVIEHLIHPERLVRLLGSCLDDAALVVISTPDRIRTRGGRHFGPSPNRGHVQEWSLRELVAFLTAEGLNVRHADHTRSNDHQDALATCLVEVAP